MNAKPLCDDLFDCCDGSGGNCKSTISPNGEKAECKCVALVCFENPPM